MTYHRLLNTTFRLLPKALMKFIHIHLWPRNLSVLFFLAFLCPSIALATPGLRPQIGVSTLEAFLRDTPGSTSYFPQRRPYASPTAQLIETETAEYTLMVFRDLGGAPYGLPVIISLSDFMRYKFHHDTHRLALERLGGRMDDDEEGDGLIDVKIPIRVPQRLSAITGEGGRQSYHQGTSPHRIVGSLAIHFGTGASGSPEHISLSHYQF